MSSSASRSGRPRKPGDRYPGGKLKPEPPPQPNARVVAMRRALLTGDPDSTAPVDLTQAENALDVALARRWLTEDRHRVALRYGALFRTAIGALPTLRVAKPLSDNLSAPSALQPHTEGVSRSGVLTPEDHAIAAAMSRPDATLREINAALKAHRQAKIDWSRMPAADVAKVFDAALEATMAGAPSEERAERATSTLRGLWDRLTPEQARELFDVCVLARWPEWVTLRAFGRPVPRALERRRVVLEIGLDVVGAELRRQSSTRPAA